MIIDSNLVSPLKYTDPTYQALLFVRANIYDITSGSPILENTVNLSLINNGCYQGKYQFTAGKIYFIQKLVYTDGTYTTVDQTFAQDNDEAQCINLSGSINSIIASNGTLILADQAETLIQVEILEELA